MDWLILGIGYVAIILSLVLLFLGSYRYSQHNLWDGAQAKKDIQKANRLVYVSLGLCLVAGVCIFILKTMPH